MSDTPTPHAALLNSIIGAGTRFKGEFDLEGLLRIDGDFTGTIRTKGQIIVGLNGRARCNIYAESVVVGGMVKGNIFSTDKVIILSTGLMIGNISTPRLIVEEGVVLSGNCKILGNGLEQNRKEREPSGTVYRTVYRTASRTINRTEEVRSYRPEPDTVSVKN